MRKILKLAREADAMLVVVLYNNHGQTKVGYDIVDKDMNILVSYEPSNGISKRTSWRIRNYCNGYSNIAKSLNSILCYKQEIQPGPTGYIFGHVKK